MGDMGLVSAKQDSAGGEVSRCSSDREEIQVWGCPLGLGRGERQGTERQGTDTFEG